MGYKLAGFDVVGHLDIDPKMVKLYKANHNPKFSFCMDIRDFNKLENLPGELYDLDILDGSPPCTTFSTAGLREETWGKEKQFAEGQAKQVLDDLFFHFIDTVKKLRPKVYVAENVAGLLIGNAKGYVNEIVKRIKGLGYTCQLFKLDAQDYGVPSKRPRVFFVGYDSQRFSFAPLVAPAKEPRIPVKFIMENEPRNPLPLRFRKLLPFLKAGDKNLGQIYARIGQKRRDFCSQVVCENEVLISVTSRKKAMVAVLTSKGNKKEKYFNDKFTDLNEVLNCVHSKTTRMTAIKNEATLLMVNNHEVVNATTFPQDYDFGKANVNFVCGMSVPPVFMAHIATVIKEQWFHL